MESFMEGVPRMPAVSLYLASQSPRRRELLTQIGVAYQVLPADTDESRSAGESPAAYVQRLALDKARAGWHEALRQGLPALPVLGADTAVVLGTEVLGKPADFAAAQTMLRTLSGRSHQVLTGIAVYDGQHHTVAMSTTTVWLRELSDAEIESYWASGEPCDKAGAYGIQGLAAVFIERIEGSYSGVVGLPLFETAQLLDQFGVAYGLSEVRESGSSES